MTKAQLREWQLQEALKAVTAQPGITAYTVGLHVPVDQPDGLVTEIVANSAPLTLVLSLLGDLEKQGAVRSVADPKGRQWYPVAGAEGSGGPS